MTVARSDTGHDGADRRAGHANASHASEAFGRGEAQALEVGSNRAGHEACRAVLYAQERPALAAA